MQQLRLLHGGDYNPEQWLDRPDILAQDIELMKKAHVNTVTLGVFSWSTLEPQEGVFELDWLADIIHNLYANGIYTILATPSAARPAWMAHKYPEVRRVRADRVRELYNRRQNYCYTSPVYREKVRIIDQKLAQQFGNDPAVLLLAYLQRDERRLPLRAVSGCVPPLAQGTVQLFGSLEQGVERPVLESRLYRLGTNRKPCPAGGKCRAGSCAGLEALCQ